MTLKIVNPQGKTFNEQVGISEERAAQLSKKLDEMVASFGTEPVAVRSCDVFDIVTGFCNTLEEVIYCTVLHCGWHAARGFRFVI